jgi:hypothetical protein
MDGSPKKLVGVPQANVEFRTRGLKYSEGVGLSHELSLRKSSHSLCNSVVNGV